jgi:triphosphoribosyl-dephospho-CoA synthase
MTDAAELIRLACRAEVLARKPGNVHPGASFVDLTVQDFLRAATACAEPLVAGGSIGVGSSVFDAVRATKQIASNNVNLGICLLIAPCAASNPELPFPAAIRLVLESLTVEDCRWVYRAIRLAQPGGLGEASEQDVADEPTVDLRETMKLAAARDRVAAQYVNGFEDVWRAATEILARELKSDPERAIIHAHLRLMAELPDSLIARKCGGEIAGESQRRAADALEAIGTADFEPRLTELDRWLRADGHRRNPGTTADLVATSLMVALKWRLISADSLRIWCDRQESAIGRSREKSVL